MNKHKELYIKVDPKETAVFIAAVDAKLKDGWTRALPAEQRAKAMGGFDKIRAYYSCDQRNQRERAMAGHHPA